MTLLVSVSAFADSQARVVRLSDVQGDVQIDRATGQGYEKAFLNIPITQDTKLKTASDGRAEVEFEEDAYPVTINDPKATEGAVRVLKRLQGMKIKHMEAILGGEDFSRFLQKAPGTFFGISLANQGSNGFHCSGDKGRTK